MLRIVRDAYQAMIAHAQRDLPIEACGYLAEREGVVRRHYELKNQDESGTHFSFAPEEQFKVVRQMRRAGLKLRAVYHSHPATPARPSLEDIRLAADPNLSYVIVSLLRPEPETIAFKVVANRVQSEEIQMVEDG